MIRKWIKKIQATRAAEVVEHSCIPNYSTYKLRITQKLIYCAAVSIGLFIIAYIFYRNIIFCIVVMLLSPLFLKQIEERLLQNKRHELELQFKDLLYSLTSSLSAGRQMEMAFVDVLKDLSILYPDPQTDIIVEVDLIIQRLQMNQTLEDVMMDFANRAQNEDISSFADVFKACRRSGGNIVEIMRNTSAIIGDRLETRLQIETLLAEKKFEIKALNAIPIAMVFILSQSAEEYMRPLFSTVTGRIATTFSIVLLIFAWLISKKIMEIKV